jgi:hypothetical protein
MPGHDAGNSVAGREPWFRGCRVAVVLVSDRWDVARLPEESSVVVPAGVLGGGESESDSAFHGRRGLVGSVMNGPVVLSGRALS